MGVKQVWFLHTGWCKVPIAQAIIELKLPKLDPKNPFATLSLSRSYLDWILKVYLNGLKSVQGSYYYLTNPM